MISSLRLQHFRSYKDESFEFSPGVNIIVGPNGCGKTNLLEAILLLSRAASYRARPAEMVRFGASWSRVDGQFGPRSRTVKIRLDDNNQSFVEFEIDNQKFKRLGLQRLIPTVLFEPNDLQLLIRGPDNRRDYMDELLTRTNLGFKALKNAYLRALRQRNALLKQEGGRQQDQLFAWNIRLSELGGSLAESRLSLIDRINQVIEHHYAQIAQQSTPLSLHYVTSLKPSAYGSSLLKKLEASTSLDYQRGFTGIGPHRDDIAVKLNNQPAEHSASRGETRTILLALKIFELQLLEELFEQKPLLLLDDVFSELDGKRRRYLVEYLQDHQVFITTTDTDAVVEHFLDGYQIILVAQNK